MTKQNQLRETCLSMVDNIFQIGMKYVKHRRISAFFISIFKPRLDNIIRVDASDKDLLDVMWMVKKTIDPVLKEFDMIEEVVESREYNSPEIQHQVEKMLLKKSAFTTEDMKKGMELLEEIGM